MVMAKWRIFLLASSVVAMAQVRGEAQTCDLLTLQTTTTTAEAKALAGATGMDDVLSLCFMFIVGVSTGFLWNGFHKLATVRTTTTTTTTTTPADPPATPRSTRKMARASSVGSLQQYRLKEIEDMTDQFGFQLGRGGQGVVYLASLPEGRGKVAVKRLQRKEAIVNHHRSQEVDLEKAFWAELNTISRLHHRNLVALLGYCVEDDELFLVYEFMGKGSLSQHLHAKQDGAEPGLNWKARMRCAVEVAQGLEYLHSHANPSLVHRDIKSGNILFDHDMNAKIADFGLSRAVALDHDATVTTRVRGTHGYVDPVYMQNGVPCDKNDVYSYGVVLLELITGRKAIQQNVSLVHWCKDLLVSDEPLMRHLLPRMVDTRMSLDISLEQLFEVVKVARGCLHEKQELRPSMQDVVAMLHYANGNDLSTSTEIPSADHIQVPLSRFGSSVGSSHEGSVVNNPPTHSTQLFDCSPSYEVKENSVLVKCTVAGARVVLRCKIWPTPRNFGLNKVEASLNGAFLWKKGLWFYNAKSSREFTVGDDIKLVAEWHVTLRTNWDAALAATDPRLRRPGGPFCIEYLALRNDRNVALVEYHGDKSPLPRMPSPERKPRRESSGSGSGSTERRRRRLRRSSSPS